jgi:nicotinic acid phosphoribosyltransferase
MNVNDPCPEAYPAEVAAGDELALLTDLYELTMLQAYFTGEMCAEAVVADHR